MKNAPHLLAFVMIIFVGHPDIKVSASADVLTQTVRFGSECAREAGIASSDIKNIQPSDIYNHGANKLTQPWKPCFLLCFYQKVGIINAAGSPKLPEFVSYTAKRFPASKEANITEALAKCGPSTKDDVCRKFYTFDVCLYRYLKGGGRL